MSSPTGAVPAAPKRPNWKRDLWQAYKDKGVVVLGVATWAQDNPTKSASGFCQRVRS